MPRGIPNAKRDDLGMRFTTFHVPLLPNPKQTGTNYLRGEQQTLWYRNARSRARPNAAIQDLIPEGRRGSKVIVIHPGSRWVRIGRASDVSPISVPHVIARKNKPPVPPPRFISCVSRPRKGKGPAAPSGGAQSGDEYAVVVPSDDPVEEKIAAISLALRDRMRFYKLRVTANAAMISSSFNEHFKAETMTELTDVARVKWINEPLKDETPLIGEDAFRLSDPQQLGYVVKRPIYGSNFNTREYTSVQHCVSDIETIWTEVLRDKLAIDPKTFSEYSVVLVIPDLWDRSYVQALINMLLVNMGFKQLCAQQESLAATYGAGISNACVIDIGAVKTSIACVDDGLVLQDTRMCLNVGGDDITEFLYVLLERISFPYKEINLVRSYDWTLMEDLKARLCTLTESDVALNLYDFVIRRPGKPFLKYGLRAYDEVILAPMCLFEPRVVEFDQKRVGLWSPSHIDVSDEVYEHITDRLTNAMLISTQHLMPQAQPGPFTPSPVPTPNPLPTASETTDAAPAPALPQGEATFSVQPQPAEGTPPSQMSNFTGSKTTKFIAVDTSKFESSEAEANATTSVEGGGGDKEDKTGENGKTSAEGKVDGGQIDKNGDGANAKAEMEPETEVKIAATEREGEGGSLLTKDTTGNGGGSQDQVDSASMDVDVVQGMESKQAAMSVEDSRPPSPPQPPQDITESVTVHQPAPQVQQQASTSTNGNGQTHHGGVANTPYLGNMPIDVVFEASKLPLDVAIFNSARAAGGDERIRKYLQAVLVVGGTAHIPGMAHALESRLQAIATPLVPNMEKVQIIPPPKDVDPRLLVWKGAAVLGKMDGVSDLWVTTADWELLGMRGLKERCYYL